MGYTVAVAGATGNVGQEMLKTLHERDFPVDDVIALGLQPFRRKRSLLW